jgi:hypothetical protein
MADSIDWTDTKLRSLDELARIAFPADAGVTAATLKRRARQGKLAVFRPGKVYVATLADIWAMLEATRVQPKSPSGSEAGSVRKRFSASETERPEVVQARVLAKLAVRHAPNRRS